MFEVSKKKPPAELGRPFFISLTIKLEGKIRWKNLPIQTRKYLLQKTFLSMHYNRPKERKIQSRKKISTSVG